FRGDDVDKKVKVLSGGERNRLALCKLLLQPINVLVMDEPTNHLDLPARESLESALREYAGTLLFVSHDRYFINALAGKIYEIADGGVEEFDGSFDEYRMKKECEQQQEPEQPIAKKTAAQIADVKNPKQRRAEEAKRRERISSLEKKIAAAEERTAELNAQIEDNPTDFELLSKNCAELEILKVKHEKLIEEWMLIADDT
ncbi:MAG: ATP-binding cassette domain-containing protein, partial [Christensenella sp.]